MELVYELGHLPLETVKREVNHSYIRFNDGSPMDLLFGTSAWFTVRDPHWHCMIVDFDGNIPDAEDWHRDGLHMDVRWMMLWTNHVPTHIRRRDTLQEITMKPFTLTLIDNERCEHRAPRLSQLDCEQRWLIRSHIHHSLSEAQIWHAFDKLAVICP